MRILGISCYYHDSAAALTEDGNVITAAQEERFSRVKHDPSFPTRAIAFCLRKANIAPADLDWVVFYEKPFLKFERITLSALSTVPFSRSQFVNAYHTLLLSKLWIRTTIAKHLGIPINKIVFSTHHLSHAASAFYTSPFTSSAIVTCDGVGEWTTTAWGRGYENSISLDYEISFPHSLGLLYSTFTQFLGYEINDGEYKVMGLAPYGKPRFTSRINKMLKQQRDGSFQLNMRYFAFHRSDKISYSQSFIDLIGLLPLSPARAETPPQSYADVAASIQQVLEEKLLTIAKYVRKRTGEENLCFAGGVALNALANWKIFKTSGFKNIYVHPAAGDAGGAIGAALYMYHHICKKPRTFSFKTIYLGEENTPQTVATFIKKKGIDAVKCSERKLVDRVVDLLIKGNVVGWVQGRFEWGPRALGARSILADPRNPAMRDLVNKKIKFREAFRPFAPVVPIEEGNRFFEVGHPPYPSLLSYMLAVVPVRNRVRHQLGAVTHVDGSARPQFLEKSLNPVYYNVIKGFGQASGTPALLNTSFNLRGEPIVNTCNEAYETFMRSGLDALVLENYLIVKK